MTQVKLSKNEVIWFAWADDITSKFSRLSFTNFTWTILEYLDPYNILNY